MLTVKAYAKINLVLEVIGRRSDGYHDIASIIHTIDLCDTLSFIPARDIELICNKPELNFPDNLSLKAARLLQEASHYPQGVTIHLQKKIPIAAGLGGGSSDAAATLLALNELWNLNFSLSQLHHIASDIGFDIPFFLYGGAAFVEGRGDWITPLPALDTLTLVLLHPAINITNKTGKLYASLNPEQYTSGNLANLVAGQLRRERIISPVSYFNVFETVAPRIFPSLDEYRQQFLSAGAAAVHLSGSGPTLFSIMPDQDSAEKVTEKLRGAGLEAFLTRTLEKPENNIYLNNDTIEEKIDYA